MALWDEAPVKPPWKGVTTVDQNTCVECGHVLPYVLLRYGSKKCPCAYHSGQRIVWPFLACPRCAYVFLEGAVVMAYFGVEDRLN